MWLWGSGWTAIIALVGAGLNTLSFSPPDFLLARTCFILAAVVLMGITTVWLWKIWPPNNKVQIAGAIVSYLLAIVWLNGSMIYVSHRQAEAQTPPGGVRGNCNVFGNNNINCSTFNLAPLPRAIPLAEAAGLSTAFARVSTIGTIKVQTDLMSCPDCDGFAKQIEGILRSAPHFTIIPVRNGITMLPFKGVMLAVKNKDALPESAKAIIEIFHSVGSNLQAFSDEQIENGVDAILVIAQPLT